MDVASQLFKMFQIYQQHEQKQKQQQKFSDHSKTPQSFLTAESFQSSPMEDEVDADDFELEEMENVMLQSLEDRIKRHWRGIAATTSSNFLANIE
jgi:hypothetical protein